MSANGRQQKQVFSDVLKEADGSSSDTGAEGGKRILQKRAMNQNLKPRQVSGKLAGESSLKPRPTSTIGTKRFTSTVPSADTQGEQDVPIEPVLKKICGTSKAKHAKQEKRDADQSDLGEGGPTGNIIQAGKSHGKGAKRKRTAKSNVAKSLSFDSDSSVVSTEEPRPKRQATGFPVKSALKQGPSKKAVTLSSLPPKAAIFHPGNPSNVWGGDPYDWAKAERQEEEEVLKERVKARASGQAFSIFGVSEVRDTSELSAADLAKELHVRGLPTSGAKLELKARLEQALQGKQKQGLPVRRSKSASKRPTKRKGDSLLNFDDFKFGPDAVSSEES
ncbi:hypothetical protein DIPPA_34088 [Diplonema papillatum]|nr:hypothetical protein DIPPA_34088 [Diplonema papillatum]